VGILASADWGTTQVGCQLLVMNGRQSRTCMQAIDAGRAAQRADFPHGRWVESIFRKRDFDA